MRFTDLTINEQPITNSEVDFSLFETKGNVDTPYYQYDLGVLKATLKSLKKSIDHHNFKIHYALKANRNPEIIRMILDYDLGADCVSGNELKAAVTAGFSPNDIAFAGVGKTDEEILLALHYDVFSFNVESIQELKVIKELAQHQNKVAKCAIRINPNINANTHKYITTGLSENKFGIREDQLNEVIEIFKDSDHIELNGLHFHIGSQITDLSPFKELCLKVNELQLFFESKGIQLEHINLGGGLGIDYYNHHVIPDFEKFFFVFQQNLERRLHQEIHFELGRSIVGQCGTLMTKALYVKEGVSTDFVICDAGMTELMRPALYQSKHSIENLTSDKPAKRYDVVGPICESADCFGKSLELNETKRGDLIAIRSAGAYGEVMASRYNARSLVKSICVGG